MTKSEIIQNIKDNLKTIFSTEAKFGSFTLGDGTKITSVDIELKEGSEVYALDEQGNQTPLENGDYVLEDGTTISVADNKVTAVKAVEVIEEVEAEVEAADVPVEEEVKVDTELADRVSALEAQVTEVLSLLQEIAGGQGTMMSAINILKGEPADSAIKKNEFAKVSENKDRTEIAELRELMKFADLDGDTGNTTKVDALSELRDLMKLNNKQN